MYFPLLFSAVVDALFRLRKTYRYLLTSDMNSSVLARSILMLTSVLKILHTTVAPKKEGYFRQTKKKAVTEAVVMKRLYYKLFYTLRESPG